ncbi:MAG: barstar family protein [Betaproteobacteria bacterium]|nr:barstar family protein [Betaproteobacteria bacterium]MDH5349786.1 barstar family protein [Betaproteobacteria bacterium]
MGKLTQRLSDATRSGVYRSTGTAEIEDAVRGTRLDLAHVALGGVEDKDGLLGRLAQALGFPEWFGGNWDALEDCLCDLAWRPGDGHVVVLDGGDALGVDDMGVLVDVLSSCAAYWAERGRPFFAVFVDPQHALALPELFRAKGAAA